MLKKVNKVALFGLGILLIVLQAAEPMLIRTSQSGDLEKPTANPIPASSDLSGDYTVQGWDPYNESKFIGFFTLKKEENDIYQAQWVSGNRKFMGTGMMCCENTMAYISISNSHEISLGIQNIVGKGLKGKWVALHQSLIGTEEFEKK